MIIYAVQVLIDVGLCIAFYDIIEVGDPYIYPAEGSAHQKVKFRLGILKCGMRFGKLVIYGLNFNVGSYFFFFYCLVVFRPFIGEVLTGKVLSCREDGIRGKEDARV